MVQSATKKCQKCAHILDVCHFGKDSTRADGLKYVCNMCRVKERKLYREKNRSKLAYYSFNRRRTDLNYKLRLNLRSRLSMALKGTKSSSASKDLGCSMDQFKDWIERQWEEGMSWDNYGNRKGQWNLDHEYPLSLIDLSNRLQALPLLHYTNYKPMWHEKNISKGNRLV